MCQNTKKIDKSLQNKLDELAKQKFSENACYSFIGNLNLSEVERFVELLRNDDRVSH